MVDPEQKRIQRRGCANDQSLSKISFLAMLPDSTREYFLSINDWSIMSFSTITKEVCILVHTSSGDRYLSYVISN